MVHSKGMSMTLWIVISAVVIVVVALVILTIFGSSMGGISNVIEFRRNCEMVGRTSCGATGFLPLTWSQNVKVGNSETSCYAELGGQAVFGDANSPECPDEWKVAPSQSPAPQE
jgi:hypothetical protein